MYKITSKNKTARTGILKTMHFAAETPFFMPVATRASVKHISSSELNEMGCEAIIANAFHLYLKPGTQLIKKAGGLHKFMNFDRCIFTDSGGFQILSEDFFVGRTDNGVIFKSYENKQHIMTPEKCMEIQQELGSDVAMCLDDVPKYGGSREHIEKSMDITHKWAKRCKESHKGKQLLFGIAQGSIFKDLRERSVKFIDSLDFDGVALGGLCIGEGKADMHKMVKASVQHISEEKPRYLMGVGSPEDILESIGMGIDIFDSAFPTQNARHGCIFTKKGKIQVEKAIFANDFKQVDDCKCPVCQNYTKAYLNHLFRAKEMLGMRLASYHNLFFIHELLRNARKAIRKGDFLKFKKSFLKSYLH